MFKFRALPQLPIAIELQQRRLVVPIGVFTNAQVQSSDCCSADGAIKPYRRVNLKVVGIVVLNVAVVQDDVDALGSEFVLFTAAFDRAFRQCCAGRPFRLLF